MKRVIALLLAVSFPFALQANAMGTHPNQVLVQNDEAFLSIGEDERNLWGSTLAMQPDWNNPASVKRGWLSCSSFDDPECPLDLKGYDAMSTAFLPMCESAVEENCIEEVSYTFNSSTQLAKFVSEVPGGERLRADANSRHYRGEKASLVRFDRAPHVAGDLYLVAARADQMFDQKRGVFETTDLTLVVIPVSSEPLSRQNAEAGLYPCVWVGEESCGITQNFPEGLRVGMSVRASKEVGGWFIGRVQDPNIKITPFSARNNIFEVEAKPVEVARFGLKAKKSEFSAKDIEAAGNIGYSGSWLDSSMSGTRIGSVSRDPSAFGLINHFRKRTNDTAIAVTTHWTLNSNNQSQGGNRCLADKSRVLGIVATNSMVYEGTSPQFNGAYLDYRVAGLHLKPDGKTPVEGSYDLLIRSETARCLYGFTNAPISATISITGTGDLKVATTLVSERDGWLKLSANGFTFSEKRIRVAMSQGRGATGQSQSLILANFARGKSTLSPQHRQSIESLIYGASRNQTLTCSGLFVRSTERALALARAKQACDHANSGKGIRTKVVTAQVKSQGQNSRVTLSLR